MELNVSEQPYGSLRFDIVDTGVGITDEELRHIFDPFKQVEAGKAAGGTGLGLAITKRLADAMGAVIEVQSERGRGSTFTLVMPLVEAEPEQWPEKSDAASIDDQHFTLADHQQWTILIADDRDTNRGVLRGMLEPVGFRTRLAADGSEALQTLKEHDDIDLVLMDVRMPGVSGSEALKMIRDDPNLRAVKVIAVTASVFPEFRKKAIETGFDDFLAKPFRTSELMGKLEKHLGVVFKTEPIEESAATAEASIPAELEVVSSDFTRRLRDALEFKNLTAISDLSAELRADPATAKTGEVLSDLIDAFDFDGIRRLVNKLENQHG